MGAFALRILWFCCFQGIYFHFSIKKGLGLLLIYIVMINYIDFNNHIKLLSYYRELPSVSSFSRSRKFM